MTDQPTFPFRKQDGALPGLPATGRALPQFEVALRPPDLSPWRAGNAGIPGIMRFEAAELGPNLVITALMHGNEIAGAIVLDQLLRDGIRPLRGTLTLGFLNLAAFNRFDPADPTASRFVEEDMNRVWDRTILAGHRDTIELARARALRPVFDAADILLDLHSMLWPSDPLILSGATEKGRLLAATLDAPSLIVADGGHRAGPRLIDYAPFADPDARPTACLVEAGPHWQPDTVDTTRTSVLSLLRNTGMIHHAPPPTPPARPRFATVTEVITAQTSQFAFARHFRGGEVIEKTGTLLAHDGQQEIRSPYENCLMVMPSFRPSRGHTAVRLARLNRQSDTPSFS